MRHLVLSRLLFLVLVLSPALSPSMVAPAFGANCGDGVTLCVCGDTVIVNTVLSRSHPVLRGVCPTVEGLRVARTVNLLVVAGTMRGQGPLGPLSTGILIEPRDEEEDGPLVIRTGVIRDFDIGVQSDLSGTVAGVTLSNLQIRNSGLWGIRLDGNGNLIDSNIVERTDARAGIEVLGIGNVLYRNYVKDGKAAGVVVEGIENEVSRNIVVRNGDAAVPFGLGGILVSGTKAIVERNEVNFNIGPGVDVDGSAHTLTLNIVQSNSGDGFTVRATAARNNVSRNRLVGNGDFGIEDSSTGTGSVGTANQYRANIYRGNASGPSNPAGLP
jgi:hypothetical protein